MSAHANLATSGIKREADDHRIIDRRDIDAVARQHVEIVFDILPDLEHCIAFKQGFQRRDCRIAIDLFGFLRKHVRTAMGQRDVTGIVRAQRQAHAHKICLHGIKRGSFRVDRDQPRRGCALDPMREPVQCLDSLVAAANHTGHLRQGLAVAFGFTVVRRGLLLGRVQIGRARRAACTIAQPPEQRCKPVLLQESGERFVRNPVQLEAVERFGKRAILPELDENPAQLRVFAMFQQPLFQLRFLHLGCGIKRCSQ